MQSYFDIEEYNDLSFVVRDRTNVFGSELKNLGGRWNTNLIGGPGWLFNRKRHGKLISEWACSKKKEEKDNTRCNAIIFGLGLLFALSFLFLEVVVISGASRN